MERYSFRNDPRIRGEHRRQLREFCSSLEGDIVKLANQMGLKVISRELLPYQRGYLEKTPSMGSASGWVINVNSRDKVETQNFTVAHELGHFVLHGQQLSTLDQLDGVIRRDTDGGIDPFTYLSHGDKRMEWEANRFASEVLMPVNLFKPAFDRLKGDKAALCKLFLVTENVIERRIREVEI